LILIDVHIDFSRLSIFFKGGASFLVFRFCAAAYDSFLPGLFCTTGRKIAEVPVLRLRQAFWLFAVEQSRFAAVK